MDSTHPTGGGPGRRQFLAAGGILSFFALFSLWRMAKKSPAMGDGEAIKSPASACAPVRKKESVRMLAQDGRLVEVDAAHLGRPKKRITNEELRRWIRRNPTNNQATNNHE
ncbi:MAG TPA: hypothetical protein VHE54_09690 [Puia sp.]|nr:hypothetical protein [Puia sp.]